MKGDDVMPGMDGFITFNGTLQGGIDGGSGGDVADVNVRHSQSTDYESVVNSEKIALIDLISYVRRNELAQELMVLENNFDLELTLKQDTLTAGDNISIENNVISAISSSLNYSFNEQNTGTKWVDGKDIWQKSFLFESDLNISTNYVALPFDISDLNIDKLIQGFIAIVNSNVSYTFYPMIRKYNGVLQAVANPTNRAQSGSVLTIQYTKTEV